MNMYAENVLQRRDTYFKSIHNEYNTYFKSIHNEYSTRRVGVICLTHSAYRDGE